MLVEGLKTTYLAYVHNREYGYICVWIRCVCEPMCVCIQMCARVNIDQLTSCAQTYCKAIFNFTVVAQLLRLYLALILTP